MIGSEEEADDTPKDDSLVNPRYMGMLQVWMAMQQTLCGQKIVTQEHLDAFAQSNQPSK